MTALPFILIVPTPTPCLCLQDTSHHPTRNHIVICSCVGCFFLPYLRSVRESRDGVCFSLRHLWGLEQCLARGRENTGVQQVGRSGRGPNTLPQPVEQLLLVHLPNPGLSLCTAHILTRSHPTPHDPPGLSQQEYWSGVPFPSPGDLPKPGVKAGSPALQADSFLSEPPGKPKQ